MRLDRVACHGVDDVLVLVEHHVHDIVHAADASGFLNVRADGIAVQLPGAGAFPHHHAVICLNCRRGGNARHDRLRAAGVAGKVMKFDVAGADAKICFGHNAGNVDRRSGACRAEVGAVVRVGVHAPHAAPDALTRKAALLLLRVMAVRAKRKHDSNIAIPAARRRELVQNGRQNFIDRHGPGDIARNDGNLLPRFYQLPQRLCADGVRQRVSHGGLAAALVRNLIRRQDAQQVFIRDLDRLYAGAVSKIQPHARPPKRCAAPRSAFTTGSSSPVRKRISAPPPVQT